MPSLYGFESQTHQLPPGEGEIDVLHRPADAVNLWVPGQQVATLAGIGLRADGLHSLSDAAQAMDRVYILREPDPHKLYSKSRTRSTTLFAVEGLIQKACRTISAGYIQLCRGLLETVIPQYPAFVAHHAELLVVWQAAIDYFDAAGRGPEKAIFLEAVAARDARLAVTPEPPPEMEQPVERPLPGVPALFEDHQCPAFGTYEDPAWIGLYACDALGIVNHNQALKRVPNEDKGVHIVDTLGGAQSLVTVNEAGLYRLIATSRKPEAERFKNWLFREVLPSIRRYGRYEMPGAQAGPTAEDVRQALRAIMLDELPSVVEPIILKVIRANIDRDQQVEMIKGMTGVAERLTDIIVINREQLELSRQSIDLITPSHQLFLSAKDYVETDGVTDALRRAPKLAEPSFGLDHCTDYGKASLWMKRLCRAENRKVAANAVARMIAKDAGEEEPPLYIPEFRMKRIERDNVKVLVFNPACWARCKQTFLLPGTRTLLFPGPKPKPKPAPPSDTETNQANEV